MPIGKDSITKRVAKVDTVATQTEKVENVEAHAKETVKSAPKTAVSKTPVKTTTAKKTTTKKTTTKTAVVTNIAPETVEKVIGHKENKDIKKIELGSELPYYLL